jgi:hypothetical protein
MTANYRSVWVWAIRLPQRVHQSAQAFTRFLTDRRSSADAFVQQ